MISLLRKAVVKGNLHLKSHTMFSYFSVLTSSLQTNLPTEYPALNASLQCPGYNYSKDNLTTTGPKLLTDQNKVPILSTHSSLSLLDWFSNLWNFTSDGFDYVFGANEARKDINQNSFNLRSVTMSALDHPCPGYGVS